MSESTPGESLSYEQARTELIEVVQRLTGLAERIAAADLVVTGEGSLDAQSLGGKTPLGVAAAAGAASVPVVAVCGRTTLEPAALAAAGFAAVYALADLEPDPAVSMAEALPLLQRVGRLIAEDLARGRFAGDDSSVGSAGRE